MIIDRELEALEAYFIILRNSGAKSDDCERRLPIINKLTPLLKNKPCDGQSYREAVEELLVHMEPVEWPFCLSVIREYYYFWTNDFKAIAKLDLNTYFNIGNVEFQPMEGTLKSFWDKLDAEKFSMVEMWPLNAYISALKDEGADRDLIDTRVKLVKLLIVNLRTFSNNNPKNYRYAIDSTMHLFKGKETRNLFLTVVREFYYFWIGDPEAINFIQIDSLNFAV